MRSLARDEIRAIDRYAIEELGIPGVILMENAGRGAFEEICEFMAFHAIEERFESRNEESGEEGVEAPGRGREIDEDFEEDMAWLERPVAVVAGGGNNGGDGFVIARQFSIGGTPVTTYLVAPREKVKGDAKVNLDALIALGHRVVETAGNLDGLSKALFDYDLIVDAIGGTGIREPLRENPAEAVRQVNRASQEAGIPVIAVDIPTGLDCDTGIAYDPCIRAVMTVTFLARKLGFDNLGSEKYTGDVSVTQIGIDPLRVGELVGLDLE
jgi:NAD(P)H-hydrate epimerase